MVYDPCPVVTMRQGIFFVKNDFGLVIFPKK